MSDYIPEGKLDPSTFQSVMDAADVKYCLAKVSSYLVLIAVFSMVRTQTESHDRRLKYGF